jgi:peptidoglycan/xylan/chitin deacetylase (PgdA/CDA1 family)
VVALTFDCGAGDQGVAAILAALSAADVPATFFVTGKFANTHQQLLKTLIARGDLVGNHTLTHPHLTQLSDAVVAREVRDGELALSAATGADPHPLFRFPYGEYDARTLALVHQLGYGAIGWTVDTRGWQGREAGTAADVVSRVRAALRPGAVVLMHMGANPNDGTTFDADALPRVITLIRSLGYGFVRIGPLVPSG